MLMAFLRNFHNLKICISYKIFTKRSIDAIVFSAECSGFTINVRGSRNR